MRELLDPALVAYLQTEGVTVPVLPGFSTSDKTGLCVVARSVSAQNEDWPSGNLTVECAVEVRGPAGASGYDALCTQVYGIVCNTNFVDGVTTSSGGTLHVFGFSSHPRTEWELDEDAWITRYAFTLYAAPSSLT
jgi:hypothetical protein